eukprot:1021787-Lingulodinium_polyedra.AAC.1
MRRPPHGGRRVECVRCEMCGAAAVECVFKRMSEQLACESCSEMRSDLHFVVAMPRISQARVPCVDRHMVVDAWCALRK